MSAFDSGFNMGLSMYQQALDNKRRGELDARAAEEYTWKQADRARLDTRNAEEDRAMAAYRQMLETGRVQDTSAPHVALARPESSDMVGPPATASGLPIRLTSQEPPGVAGPPMSAAFAGSPPMPTRRATEVDRFRALEGIALAKGDMASTVSIGAARKAAQTSQDVAQWMREYTGADEQIGQAAMYLNATSSRVTMGAPGKNSMIPLSIVKPDGRAEFLNLSRQQQAQLYAASKLMDIDPARALEMMGGVNKDLAAAIAAENGLVDTVTQRQNTAAYQGGMLGVAQQNANTNEAYRRDTANAALQRANNAGSGPAARPVKMDVETLDPITGKKSKVVVLLNPATGEATTADGKPFKDSAALDRAMGRMDENARFDAAEANDLQLLEAQFKAGLLVPGKGQSPMQALEAARNEVRQMWASRRGAAEFSRLDNGEKVDTLRRMAAASGKAPAKLAPLVGADPKFVAEALKGTTKAGGLPPVKRTAPPRSALEQAYDEWQAAKPSWFQQRTPTSEAREREAEQRYTELLRNQYAK